MLLITSIDQLTDWASLVEIYRQVVVEGIKETAMMMASKDDPNKM